MYEHQCIDSEYIGYNTISPLTVENCVKPNLIVCRILLRKMVGKLCSLSPSLSIKIKLPNHSILCMDNHLIAFAAECQTQRWTLALLLQSGLAFCIMHYIASLLKWQAEIYIYGKFGRVDNTWMCCGGCLKVRQHDNA